MCKLCDEGKPQDHTASLRESRRDFLKVSTATAIAASGVNLLTARLPWRRRTKTTPLPIAASRARATSFAAVP